jgi:hypothetical protein
VDGRTAKQQQMADAQKKKKRKMPVLQTEENETHQVPLHCFFFLMTLEPRVE